MKFKPDVDFFGNGLCTHCNSVINDLCDFIAYNSKIENFWELRDEQLQNNIDKELENFPKEVHHEVVEGYALELNENQFMFPSIHRESLIITIFNFVEHQLNLLCNIINDSLETKIRLKDLQGKGFERAILYLKKIAHFDFSVMNSEYSYLKSVNQLRNIIVHNGNVLPEESQHKIFEFIKSNSNICGNVNQTTKIMSEFIDELIQKMINFFEKIDQQVQSLIQKKND